jgi:hypothetical protein
MDTNMDAPVAPPMVVSANVRESDLCDLLHLAMLLGLFLVPVEEASHPANSFNHREDADSEMDAAFPIIDHVIVLTISRCDCS